MTSFGPNWLTMWTRRLWSRGTASGSYEMMRLGRVKASASFDLRSRAGTETSAKASTAINSRRPARNLFITDLLAPKTREARTNRLTEPAVRRPRVTRLALVRQLLQSRIPLDVAGAAVEVDVRHRFEDPHGPGSALRAAIGHLQGPEPVEEVHHRPRDDEEAQEHGEGEPVLRPRFAADRDHAAERDEDDEHRTDEDIRRLPHLAPRLGVGLLLAILLEERRRLPPGWPDLARGVVDASRTHGQALGEELHLAVPRLDDQGPLAPVLRLR